MEQFTEQNLDRPSSLALSNDGDVALIPIYLRRRDNSLMVACDKVTRRFDDPEYEDPRKYRVPGETIGLTDIGGVELNGKGFALVKRRVNSRSIPRGCQGTCGCIRKVSTCSPTIKSAWKVSEAAQSCKNYADDATLLFLGANPPSFPLCRSPLRFCLDGPGVPKEVSIADLDNIANDTFVVSEIRSFLKGYAYAYSSADESRRSQDGSESTMPSEITDNRCGYLVGRLEQEIKLLSDEDRESSVITQRVKSIWQRLSSEVQDQMPSGI